MFRRKAPAKSDLPVLIHANRTFIANSNVLPILQSHNYASIVVFGYRNDSKAAIELGPE
jgi:hypothetical protein